MDRHTLVEEWEAHGYRCQGHYDWDAQDPRKAFDNYDEEDVAAWEGGEVFGWVVLTPEGEPVDSCWGYYGWREMAYLKECATAAAQYAQQKANDDLLAALLCA